MSGPFEKIVERIFDTLPDNVGFGRIKQIFVNPTPEEMRKFAIGRGYISKDGTVYFWEYELATHQFIEKYTKDKMLVAFYTAYRPGEPGARAGLRIHVSDYSTTMAGDKAVAKILANKTIKSIKPDLVSENPVLWGSAAKFASGTFKRWIDGKWVLVNGEGVPVDDD